MSTYDPESLSRKIKEALSRPRAVLFCGAGVGVHVGLPTWKQYVLHLAQVCEKYNDNTAAQLIRERIDDDDYPGAATIYKTCRRIPISSAAKSRRDRTHRPTYKVKTDRHCHHKL
jgi:hypothetical protein